MECLIVLMKRLNVFEKIFEMCFSVSTRKICYVKVQGTVIALLKILEIEGNNSLKPTHNHAVMRRKQKFPAE